MVPVVATGRVGIGFFIVGSVTGVIAGGVLLILLLLSGAIYAWSVHTHIIITAYKLLIVGC